MNSIFLLLAKAFFNPLTFLILFPLFKLNSIYKHNNRLYIEIKLLKF